MKANKLAYFFCLWCMPLGIMAQSTLATEGNLDLSDQQWSDQTQISLRGQWEFYWQQLLIPSDWQSASPPTPTQYVSVPASWTTYRNADESLYPAKSYATYRLRFFIKPDPNTEYALKVPMIWTAAKVWLNGKLIHEAGIVGTSPAATRGQVIGNLVSFRPHPEGWQEIVVQVSNHGLFISGLLQDFVLGNERDLILDKEWTSSRSLMWLGILAIMSLYHFILFIFRPQNRSTLYFGIICLLIALRLSVFGEHYVYEYLQLYASFFNTELQPKIYYIGTYVLAPLGLLYMRSLYPEEFHWKSVRLRRRSYSLPILSAAIITTIYALFIVFTPLRIYGSTILFYQPFFFLFLSYLAFVIVQAVRHERKDAWIQMGGALVMIFAGINDGLHSVLGIELVGEMELLPVAFGVFLILQFFVIARRFSLAFRQVEELSENLEEKVVQRTHELTQKTHELEKTNKHITDSVRYARRIQQSILGEPVVDKRYFSDAFVFFRPRDIVSGDFYWFAECPDEETYLVVAADCTGHGVPGAFMTVMGNDFLNEIVNNQKIFSPKQILQALDQKISSSLHRSNGKAVADGMDISILAYHKPTQTLRFAGAKNPMLLLRNDELIFIRGSRFPIGGNFDAHQKNFEEHLIEAQPNDRLYLYSDGFQDQFGGDKGQKYLSKRFRAFLHAHSHQTFEEQANTLEQELQGWRGTAKQTDDILVIGLKI
ncbi:MAG: SpoIIE family protein phosphatase [Bernardetiaceae bacterium]